MQKVRLSYNDVQKGFFEGMFSTEKFLKQSGISPALIHLIKVRASQINGCGYCLDMHHKEAIKDGETFDRLYLLPAWSESPCFSEEEKAVINFTEVITLISERNSDAIEAAYDRVGNYFSKSEVADIILAITQINAWNRIAISFGNIPGSYEVSR